MLPTKTVSLKVSYWALVLLCLAASASLADTKTETPQTTSPAGEPTTLGQQPSEPAKEDRQKIAPEELNSKPLVSTKKAVTLEQTKTRDAQYTLAASLFKVKKYKEATAALQKAVATGADNGESGILLGYCYYELKKYPEAMKEYQRVAATAPLISTKNKAQKLAQTLSSYMRGICPGNCLKPTTPGWRKMNVPGKPDRLVWMVFPYLDTGTRGGSEYWSNDHMGEVIEYVNGRPVNKGKCPICGGTGRVSLPK